MKKLKYLIAFSLAACSALADNAIRTELSFTQDEEGNLNHELFFPFYYGENNEFFSGIGYASKNLKENGTINGFSDSKTALISEQKEVRLSYINYQMRFDGFSVSMGIESRFSKINNNEFGYIHDSANVFGNGTDYYVAFDNDVELNVQMHAIVADITMPLGEYFMSRAGVSIVPLSSVAIKQETMFKPLVATNASSSSTASQALSYGAKVEFQSNTKSWVDFVLLASYNYQPLKYDIAQPSHNGTNFVFANATIDTHESTVKYGAKVLFDYEVLGGLRPSLGYTGESLSRKNNTTGSTATTDTALLGIGFERRF